MIFNHQSLITNPCISCKRVGGGATGVPKPNPVRSKEPVRQGTRFPPYGIDFPQCRRERTADSFTTGSAGSLKGTGAVRPDTPSRGLPRAGQNRYTGRPHGEDTNKVLPPTFTAVLKPVARNKKENQKRETVGAYRCVCPGGHIGSPLQNPDSLFPLPVSGRGLGG